MERFDAQHYQNSNVTSANTAKAESQSNRHAIAQHDLASMIVTNRVSQFDVLKHLVKDAGVDWSCTLSFHLHDSVGLPMIHPTLLRACLRERFVQHVPLKSFIESFLGGDAKMETAQLGGLIKQHNLIVGCIGIEESP